MDPDLRLSGADPDTLRQGSRELGQLSSWCIRCMNNPRQTWGSDLFCGPVIPDPAGGVRVPYKTVQWPGLSVTTALELAWSSAGACFSKQILSARPCLRALSHAPTCARQAESYSRHLPKYPSDYEAWT